MTDPKGDAWSPVFTVETTRECTAVTQCSPPSASSFAGKTTAQPPTPVWSQQRVPVDGSVGRIVKHFP